MSEINRTVEELFKKIYKILLEFRLNESIEIFPLVSRPNKRYTRVSRMKYSSTTVAPRAGLRDLEAPLLTVECGYNLRQSSFRRRHEGRCRGKKPNSYVPKPARSQSLETMRP